METLQKIKELVEKLSIDSTKVFEKNNRSASVRARRYAQQIREIMPKFRKEILNEMKKNVN
jgi:RNase P subunit RPR2